MHNDHCMPSRKAEFVLGVDLDGTCADFYAGIRRVAAEWLRKPSDDLTTEVSYGLGEWGFDKPEYLRMHRWAVRHRELFLSLSTLDEAPQCLRRLSRDGVRIRIITHRLFVPYFSAEVAQTTEWLDHHGIPYWDLCFMADKDAVGADLYVEDSPDNIEALRDGGAEVVIFSNSTGGHLPGLRADTWGQVESIVRDRLEVSGLAGEGTSEGPADPSHLP
jgi:beta-phosphoglucomutase-like phosphatase (HAD superfamily)